MSSLYDAYKTYETNNATMISFGEAIEEIKSGKRATREAWGSKSYWVEAQYPDEHSKMTIPYLVFCINDYERTPWIPTTSDFFEDDWIILNNEVKNGE